MRKRVLAGLVPLVVLLTTAPSAQAADFRCPPGASTLPPVVDGNVIVLPDAFCIGFGTIVRGNVKVEPNAIGFHAHGMTIAGNVQSENPQLDIRVLASEVGGDIQAKRLRPGTGGAVCRSEVGGDIEVLESQGTMTIGIGFPLDVCTGGNAIAGDVKVEKSVSNLSAGIRGNTIAGNLQYFENTGQHLIQTNQVGQDLQFFKNTGLSNLLLNTVRENLQCKDNTPPPTGAGNVARRKEDQCAAL